MQDKGYSRRVLRNTGLDDCYPENCISARLPLTVVDGDLTGDDFEVLNQESLVSLESWVQKTATKLVQVNGQRKYGGPPPDWTGPVPGPGCEVFISQIPRDVYEDKLIPLFQSVGPLYEFRLMMNFSGQNRGFAYAKYRDPHSAAAAIRSLHLHELQRGVLRALSDGVESVSLKFGKGGKRVTAIVHYTSHYNASMAKKVLCEAFKKKFGLIITVKWFNFSSKPKQGENDDEDVGQQPFLAQKGIPKPCPLPPCRPIPDRERPPRFQDNLKLTRYPPPPAVPKPPDALATLDAVTLLLRVCEAFKVGTPLYDLQFLHTGSNGFLYFAYRVLIPGLPLPFTGLAQILPGTSAPLLRSEVQRVAAENVLKHLAQP
ncbi:hypothetical protein GJAV_G00196580 [Gymnothorax javanicus]|nr:hypothetical protein GJAV_G00196580 [Gymnothorax javanicus]